jgi:flagellar biosynthesis/type III secretory pathway protein FliH
MLVAALERERRSIYQEGREEGREEGRVEGVQQTLLHLLQWRFALSAQEQANLAQQVAAIDDLPRLARLVDLALAAASVQDFLAQLGPPGAAVDAR